MLLNVTHLFNIPKRLASSRHSFGVYICKPNSCAKSYVQSSGERPLGKGGTTEITVIRSGQKGKVHWPGDSREGGTAKRWEEGKNV